MSVASGEYLLDRLTDEGAHLKRVQTAVSEKTERPAEKLAISTERGLGSRKERTSGHKKDEDEQKSERENLEGCILVQRPSTNPRLASFCALRISVRDDVKAGGRLFGWTGKENLPEEVKNFCAREP